MKSNTRTPEYKILKRGDGRFEVRKRGGGRINGLEKVKILIKAGLIKTKLPAEKKPDQSGE